MSGELILLPNLLSQSNASKQVFAEFVRPAIAHLQGLFLESPKGGKEFKSLFKDPALNKAMISYINEHTKESDYDFYLEPLEKGERWALVSDAGLPIIADPGSHLVLKAHEKGIKVSAYGMTCSITGALMLSGLASQHFTFHGYLPRDDAQRKHEIQAIESRSQKEGSTHIFIEAPYRNEQLLHALIKTLHPDTYLSVSVDLTGESEQVVTRRVSAWGDVHLDLEKKPAVFILKGNLE